MAASNSAEVEKLALGAGMKKGGSAKGELVLAMYELANCFRNGWGIKKDPAAAKQYYETAANLGDTDAMNEVAWCYTEGFGTKKDKVCQLHSHLSDRQLCRSSPLLKLPTSSTPVDVYSSKQSCGVRT
jgi:TPR repeat protein